MDLLAPRMARWARNQIERSHDFCDRSKVSSGVGLTCLLPSSAPSSELSPPGLFADLLSPTALKALLLCGRAMAAAMSSAATSQNYTPDDSAAASSRRPPVILDHRLLEQALLEELGRVLTKTSFVHYNIGTE